MTSKKLFGDGTHGPGLGKSAMEGKREGGRKRGIGQKSHGREGRGERKGGLGQVPGRGGGRREKGWVPKRVWIFGNFDLGKRRQEEDPPRDSPP